MNYSLWGLVLWWTGLEIASLNWSESASMIIDSITWPVKDLVDSTLEWVDLSELLGYIGDNSPLSITWWEDLVWPWLFWIAWMASWYYASNKLWEWIWIDNKTDDNIAWTAWLVWWLWFWLWSATMIWAWLTWLSYVWSRKIIEKMLPANYVHLAKYLAMAPAWFVASSTWIIDASSSVLAPILAWTALFWINRFRAN